MSDPHKNANALPSSSPSLAAVELLAAAVQKTTGSNLNLVLAGDSAGENLTGSYDATHGIATISQPGANQLHLVITADELYLSGLADLEGKIVRLQTAKLKAGSPMAMFADPVAPLTLLSAPSRVEATGPNSFTGTLDLAKAHGATVGAQKFIEHLLKSGAARSSAVAFTASINQDGYLPSSTRRCPVSTAARMANTG